MRSAARQGTLGLQPKEEYAGGVIYQCGMRPEARGVVFDEYDWPGMKTVNGIATAGGAKTAWFKDPDGNILAVSQRLPT